MEPRIERRRLQCSRWLLYLAIVLSAGALARLASAGTPPSGPAIHGVIHAAMHGAAAP